MLKRDMTIEYNIIQDFFFAIKNAIRTYIYILQDNVEYYYGTIAILELVEYIHSVLVLLLYWGVFLNVVPY